MKKFCESLEEHAMKIINFEEKEMILLTNKEFESYASQAKCHICKRKFEDKYAEKLEIIAIIQVNTEVLHIAHVFKI